MFSKTKILALASVAVTLGMFSSCGKDSEESGEGPSGKSRFDVEQCKKISKSFIDATDFYDVEKAKQLVKEAIPDVKIIDPDDTQYKEKALALMLGGIAMQDAMDLSNILSLAFCAIVEDGSQNLPKFTGIFWKFSEFGPFKDRVFAASVTIISDKESESLEQLKTLFLSSTNEGISIMEGMGYGVEECMNDTLDKYPPEYTMNMEDWLADSLLEEQSYAKFEYRLNDPKTTKAVAYIEGTAVNVPFSNQEGIDLLKEYLEREKPTDAKNQSIYNNIMEQLEQRKWIRMIRIMSGNLSTSGNMEKEIGNIDASNGWQEMYDQMLEQILYHQKKSLLKDEVEGESEGEEEEEIPTIEEFRNSAYSTSLFLMALPAFDEE